MQKVLTLGLGIALVAIACAPAAKKINDPPTSAVYSLKFASAPVIADADSVQVFAFDSATPGNECPTLVQRRKARQELPARLDQTEPLPPCELLAAAQENADAGRAALESISYGERSFLAVAIRKGREYLIGCGQGTVGSGTPPVEIDLSFFDGTVAAPTNNCTQLSQKCSTPPTCQ